MNKLIVSILVLAAVFGTYYLTNNTESNEIQTSSDQGIKLN
jgi:hypothetical protein